MLCSRIRGRQNSPTSYSADPGRPEPPDEALFSEISVREHFCKKKKNEKNKKKLGNVCVCVCVCMCLSVCVFLYMCTCVVHMCACLPWRAESIMRALGRSIKYICPYKVKTFKGLNQESSLNVSFSLCGEAPELSALRGNSPWNGSKRDGGCPKWPRIPFKCLQYTQAVNSVKIQTCSPNSFPFSVKEVAQWERDGKNFKCKCWEVSQTEKDPWPVYSRSP